MSIKNTIGFALLFHTLLVNAQTSNDWEYKWAIGSGSYKTAYNLNQGILHLSLESDSIVTFDLVEKKILSKAYINRFYENGRIAFEKKYPIFQAQYYNSSNEIERLVLVNFLTGNILLDTDNYPISNFKDFYYQLDAESYFYKSKEYTKKISSTTSKFLGKGLSKIAKGKSKSIFSYGEFGEKKPAWNKEVPPIGKTGILISKSIWQNPLFNNDIIVVGYATKMFGFDRKKGELLWEKSWNTYSHEAFTSPEFVRIEDTSFYVEEKNASGEKQLNAYSFSKGEQTWDNPIKLGMSTKVWKPTLNGIIICRDKSVNVYDYKTGKELWKTDAVSTNSIYGIKTIKDKIITYHRNDGNNISYDESTLRINIIMNQSFEWGNIPEIKGKKLKFIYKSGSDYIYFTDLEIGKINSKGEVVYTKVANLSDELLWQNDTTNMNLLFIAGNNIHKFDYKNNSFEKISHFNLKGDKEEKINRFWLTNYGFAVSSSRNLISFDSNGQQIYSKYYKAPGLSTFTKRTLLSLGTLAAGAVFSDQLYDVYGSAYQAGLIGADDYWNDYERAAAFGENLGAGSIASKYIDRLVKYKKENRNSSALSNYWLVEDKFDKGDFGLRVIDINTGEESNQISISTDNSYYYKIAPSFGGIFYSNNYTLYFVKL